MHVVLLTREFEGRKKFHARLVAGSVMESEGDMSYFAEEHGVEVTRLDRLSRTISLFDDLRTFLELWRLFRRERPDIVHTHTAKAGALGRLAAALAGVPVRIHTYHGHVQGGDYFSPDKTAFFRGVESALSILTQRLVVLTRAQREEMSARMAVADAEKFAVVPLGLELEPFVPGGEDEADDADGGGEDAEGGERGGSPAAARSGARAAARSRAREELELDAEAVVVGIVGRLVPIKNHELLFDAVPHLLERLEKGAKGERTRDEDFKEAPLLRILVVGSGEREEALKAYARERGIDGHVRWLGWRKDLPEIYPAMDVLALPSRDEGTPVAVIEALAAGVPVVARDVGGVAEVLEDGKWGRLVEEPEPEASAGSRPEARPEASAEAHPKAPAHAFAEALAETLADPPSAEERDAASRSVRARFGLERLVGDLEELYLEELERARTVDEHG